MIVGTKLYGRTDAVAGLGYVATKFFHINYVPLVPLGETYFVLSESFFSDDCQVIRIRNSFKAIALGYLRGAAWLAALLFGVASVINLVAWSKGVHATFSPVEFLAFMAAAAALLALYRIPRLRTASWTRARKLASLAGANEIETARLAEHYGQIEDAERAQAEVREAARARTAATPPPLAAHGHADDSGAEREAARALLIEAMFEIPPPSEERPAPIPVARAVRTSTPNAVKFECPRCMTFGKVSTAYVGRIARCKCCRGPLQVPAPQGRRPARNTVAA